MLEKLDNNESILLMYLADELPAEDRAEIERMLAGDESLRFQLAGLQLAQATTEHALRALDAAAPAGGQARIEPGSSAESAAIRRISRSMRSHLTRTLADRPAPAAKRVLRIPWWAYPTAATAASVLAFLVWWGNTPIESPTYTKSGYKLFPNQPSGNSNVDSRVSELATFWRSEDLTPDQSGEGGRELIAKIDKGEKELAALSAGSDDGAAVWDIGDSDSGNAHE